MKTEQIKRQINEADALLAKVEQSRSGHAAAIADYERQRQGLVVAARARGNADAQQQMRQLADKISDERRDENEDASAVAQISSELSLLRSDLAKAEREDRRRELRKLITDCAAANREGRIVEQVRALEGEVESWRADKRAIALALVQFDGRLRGADGGGNEPVRVDYGTKADLQRFAANAPRIFTSALAALDGLDSEACEPATAAAD